MIKAILSVVAVGLIFYAYVPYIIGTVRREIKPHMYSWFIWGVVTAIAFAAQVTNQGGIGSFVSLFASLACFTIAGFAAFNGERDITASDTFCLVTALVAIGLWLITKQPVLSVVLATLIDLIGFAPTVRKAWNKPEDELLQSWVLTFIRYVLSVVVLSTYSFVTVCYPVSLVIAIGLFCLLLIHRRRVLLPRAEVLV